MKRKTVFGSLTLAGLAFALCAALILAPSCNKGAKNGKKVIGVSLLKENDEFYKTLKKGLQETAKKMGYDIEILSADFDEDKQDKNMDALLLKNPAAIVICPVNSRGVGAIIGKATAQNVPVFTADIAAEQGKVVAHVASDNYQGGQIAAEKMAKLLGKGALVTVIYQPGTESVASRVKGFVDKGKELGLTFVEDASGAVMMYDGNDDQQKSEEKTKAAIQSNPGLAGVFAANDNMAAGAEAAIVASGQNIVLVGYDANDIAQKKIKAGGVWKADVMQSPYDIGRITIETIDQHLKGTKVESVIPVPVKLFD